MAEKQQKIKAKKTIKKSFFEVEAPITATKIHLYAASKEELVNKTIKLDLTKNLRGKNLEVVLRIKQEGENLIAEAESAKLTSSYIRKGIRKGTDYAEDSFVVECRDCTAQVKPIFVTRRRVSRTVLNAIRIEAKTYLQASLKTRTGKEIISEITTNKLQKQLSLKLKRIYPLALCEIRVFEILKRKEISDSEE
jgi:ribosomal protein S3AE